MRNKSNPIKCHPQQNIIEEILRKHQLTKPQYLIADEDQYSYRPRFLKHKNFYTKKQEFDIHYITPTQKHAKEILDKICNVKKKDILNQRPESSFQKRKEFSADQCSTTRSFLPKRQIRVKTSQKGQLGYQYQDWLAFVLD